MASAVSAATWAVKALVEATPTSGPALVGQNRSTSRAMVEPWALTMAAVAESSGAAPAQRGQSVGRLPRLRDGEAERARGDRRIAVAELGRGLDVCGKAGQTLEQVTPDHAGVRSGAAGHDVQPVDAGEVEPVRRGGAASDGVQVARQRVLAGVGLVVDLLLHEMPVVALLDQRRRRRNRDDRPRDRRARGVKDARARMVDRDVVALVEVGDALGEGTDRHRVGAEIHLAVAVADDERRPAPRAHDELVVAVDQDRDRKRALEPVERRFQRIQGRQSGIQLGHRSAGRRPPESVSLSNVRPAS